MKGLLREAEEMRDELISWRRFLHKHPELDYDLPLTAGFVNGQLMNMGYEVKTLAGSGITAVAGGKQPGRCILLRADMDALPLQEQSEVDFKSLNGNMHACGHDMHTTMLLGAAQLLKLHEDDIPGQVKFMFQPAEEPMTGAQAMLEAGILDGPSVDAAVMIHVLPGTPLPSGTIMVPLPGQFSAASDWFEIQIAGKGGHGAMPENTVDPLNVMSHVHIALQTINSREISARDNVVITVGEMYGGEKPNVIPHMAMMKGSVRTFDAKVREFVLQRIAEIANQTALAFRAFADTRIIEGCPSVLIDAGVAGEVRQGLSEVFGPNRVVDSSLLGKMSASEDFGYISERVPALTMLLSAGSAAEGYVNSLHHPAASFNEDILPTGAAAYAVAALSWLQNNQ